MKKIIAILLVLVSLCGCTYPSQNGSEISETLPSGAVKIGTSAYSCVTGTSERTAQISDTETAQFHAFAHMIYDPNNKYICNLTNSFVCTYSESKNLSEIDASLSDEQIEGLTVSAHLSGNTATAIVYLNQLSICYFQYKLTDDGTLKFIS